MATRGLLFDLDGTLAMTDHLHEDAWRDVLSEHGVVLTSAGYLDRIRGRANEAIVAEWLPQLPADRRDTLIEAKERLFRDHARGLPLPRGLVELLDLAQQSDWAVAVVTNAPLENAEHVLGVLGIRERFEVVVGAESVKAHKPDPEPYALALAELGLAAHQAVAFEDSPSGVRSAVAAGLVTFGILTGHEAAELVAAGAGLCVAAFDAPTLRASLAELLH